MVEAKDRLLLANPSNEVDGEKGLWIWDGSFIKHSEKLDEFLWAVDANHLNTLYISYGDAPDADYRSFISTLNQKGVKVEALDGKPRWGLIENQAECEAEIDKVINYNSNASDNEKFAGIHLDNEPYLNEIPLDWDVLANRVEIMKQWLTTSQAYVDRTRNAGMECGNAIPFWLDTSQNVLDAEAEDPSLENFYQQIIDIHDYSALMSYNDDANQAIEISTNEVNYATSPKAVIGIETTKQEPINITYYEEGFLATEDAVKTINNGFVGNVGYRGIALHDYDIWIYWIRQNVWRMTNSNQISNSDRVLPSE